MRKTVFKAGRIIFKEGEVGSDAFIIVDGEVELVRKCSDGSEIVLGTLGGNQMFGEASLIDPTLRRSVTVRAVTDIVVAHVTQDSFQEKLQITPAAVKSIVKLIAKRLSDTSDMFVSLHNKMQEIVVQKVGQVIHTNKQLMQQLKEKDDQIAQLLAEIETLKISGPVKTLAAQQERQKVEKDRSMKLSHKDMDKIAEQAKNQQL